MRSARILLATAAAAAAVAIATPGVHAAAGDWDHEDSSYSKKHDSYGKDHGKEHDKEDGHDRPHGGVHAGGGALAAVNSDDWGSGRDSKYDHEKDKETYKDKHGKDSWSKDHDKPHGGIHAGGGGLASPGVSAGGLAVLAVAATGAYALRRKKAA